MYKDEMTWLEASTVMKEMLDKALKLPKVYNILTDFLWVHSITSFESRDRPPIKDICAINNKVLAYF